MQILNSSREAREVISDSKYQQTVSERLSETRQRAIEDANILTVQVDSARYIIFSDLHRGTRDRADDHRNCERAYNAALGYYYGMGHNLILLGDVEELWENPSQSIFSAYSHSIQLEARFHQEKRYIRFFGNHDEDWDSDTLVRMSLDSQYGGEPLNVREALLMEIMDGNEKLGELFFAHGHQGTLASDRFAKFSRWFVNTFWRRIQNLLGITVNTAAKDWKLRAKHDIAMYRWARSQTKLALIAGHTHRPVFKSKSHAAKIEEQLEAARALYNNDPENKQLREGVSLLMAELEWVRAQESRLDTGSEGEVVDMNTPCYFNSGCCCFPDGDITGIEIADGQIRLIHFPNDGKPKPKVLEAVSLKSVLRALE